MRRSVAGGEHLASDGDGEGTGGGLEGGLRRRVPVGREREGVGSSHDEGEIRSRRLG